MAAKEKFYDVPMTLSFRVTAWVRATSAEEAEKKAEQAEWDEDGMNAGEMFDWGVDGSPVYREDA